MFLDVLGRLMSAQAVSSSDAVSASSYDLGNVTPARRVGTGEDLCLLFVVTTAAAGDSGSLTDTFRLRAVSSAAEALTSVTVLAERRVTGAQLTAGAIFEVPIPKGTPAQRYLGAQVDVGTGDTVSLSCYIVPRSFVHDFVAYAKGYAV